ncbi:hypothetical protein [Nitrincola sp. MINF-07-Sa-05]|uniref:hypothetical protein n=1 Tax=Nitrincola salilacus TaxID=3400273 RepID=UPI00391857C4
MTNIIAKGYYGLGGNIAVLSSAMRLADLRGAKLIVDWVDGVYGLSSGDVFNEVFEFPVSNSELLKSEDFTVWPVAWQNYYKMTRPHKEVNGLQLSRVTSDMIEASGELYSGNFDAFIVSRDDKYWHHSEFSDEISKYVQQIRPQPRIVNKVNSYDLGGSSIAVHFRHGNGEITVVPPDLQWFFSKVDGYLESAPLSSVLVCTDCIRILELFRERYGDKVISTDKQYPEVGNGAMHCEDTNDGRLRSLEEAIIDIWLMSRCDFFVGSKSFFTGVALKLAGRVEKQKISVWSPVWRSHKPEPQQLPVEKFEEIADMLLGAGITLDGLFVEETGNAFELYYLYNFVCSINDLHLADIEFIREKIKGFRYY